MKFLSRRKAEPAEPASAPSEGQHDPGAAKGRPTPTRKEAEALRKQTLRVSSDPKEAKRDAKARAAQERQASRQALLSGDESALPPRDAGPVKKFVRDYVDGRYTAAELFMPMALVVVVIGLLPWSRWGVDNAQGSVSLIWIMLLLFLVIDIWFMLLRMGKQLRKQWPDPKDRKGTTFYAAMRVLQLRRLRLPPPTVRRNGQPVVPKQRKK